MTLLFRISCSGNIEDDKLKKKKKRCNDCLQKIVSFAKKKHSENWLQKQKWYKKRVLTNRNSIVSPSISEKTHLL